MSNPEANSDSEPRSWPNLTMIAGGLLMAPLLARFTTLHGPTTVDEAATGSAKAQAYGREMHRLARLPLVLIRFGLIELDEPLPEGIAP